SHLRPRRRCIRAIRCNNQWVSKTVRCAGELVLSYGKSGVDLSSADDTALIVRGVLRLSRRLRAERPESGVSLSALGMLSTLHRSGPMPAARLAQAERLQPQSLSRLIAQLDREGLIKRRPGREDRRMLILEITAAGRRAL